VDRPDVSAPLLPFPTFLISYFRHILFHCPPQKTILTD
jgi:hypothetical protein